MNIKDSFSYFLVNKPFGMLSQFKKVAGMPSLADLGNFPKDVHPVGRLDKESEGLILLTNDKNALHRLTHPKFNHSKTYFSQVDGDMHDVNIELLKSGVPITVNGEKYYTKRAKVEKIAQPDWIVERRPPIRVRKDIPTSWIKMVLTEGKYRQVRKMTAAVGHPTLRLIRTQIGDLKLKKLQPGEYIELSKSIVYNSTGLKEFNRLKENS